MEEFNIRWSDPTGNIEELFTGDAFHKYISVDSYCWTATNQHELNTINHADIQFSLLHEITLSMAVHEHNTNCWNIKITPSIEKGSTLQLIINSVVNIKHYWNK